MKESQNYNASIFDKKEHTIWEAMQQGSTHILMDLGKLERIPGNLVNGRIDRN